MSILENFWAGNSAFVNDLVERAFKTFVQVFVLQLIAAGVFTVNGIAELALYQQALVAAGGSALSVVSSLLSKKFGDADTASIVK